VALTFLTFSGAVPPSAQQKGDESTLHHNSADATSATSMKPVHPGRRLSSTVRRPKRSTVVEIPNESVHAFDVVYSSCSQEASSPRPAQSLPPAVPTPARIPVARPPEVGTGQATRPGFASNDTEMTTVDVTPAPPGDKYGHWPLSRERSIPYIADLSALELAIVQHAAVLALYRSPLRDQFKLEEILELLEIQKSGFLYKSDSESKNVKKKGAYLLLFSDQRIWRANCKCKVFLGCR
jgi:hypothetical protein